MKEENRYEARETITAVLRPWFAARTLAEIRAALDAVGACWGPYQTFAQAVAEDPRVSADNPLFDEIDQPGIGRMLAAGGMVDFSAAPRGPVRPAPVLGQHTDEVLADVLGLPEGKIGALHDAGIVAGPME
jgi:2-methylfumaryl-CoA isomerase